MKDTDYFKAKVANMLIEAGIDSEVEGGISIETSIPIEGDVILVTSPGTLPDYDVVDKADVTINILLRDLEGTSNVFRFRDIIPKVFNAINNYRTYLDDFVQYKKDKEGVETTRKIKAENEYFHLRAIFTDGITHDPQRDGYSYYSVRLECWIEK